MKIIYAVQGFNHYNLKEIKVSRETEHTIWDERNNQIRKNTSFERHFDTKSEAINYMKNLYERRIVNCQNQLNSAEKILSQFKEDYNIL